jgi:hypothetical protein
MKYHLVWVPKSRKWILRGGIRDRAKELFREIEEYHGFEIEEMEVAADDVHVFISFLSKCSISQVVRDTEGSECEGDTQGVSESEEGIMGTVAVALKSPVPEGRGFLPLEVTVKFTRSPRAVPDVL